MKIFISGNPRSGKTSLVKKLIQEFGIENFYGFYTEEIKKDKKRVGFRIVTTWGDEKILASVDIKTNYRVGKYYVIKENIDYVSEYFLKNIDKKKIIIVDEIGRMEFYSEKFKELVNFILKKDLNLIAVIHRNYLHLVPNYIWLEIGEWWDVYKKIKNALEKYISYGKSMG